MYVMHAAMLTVFTGILSILFEEAGSREEEEEARSSKLKDQSWKP